MKFCVRAERENEYFAPVVHHLHTHISSFLYERDKRRTLPLLLSFSPSTHSLSPSSHVHIIHFTHVPFFSSFCVSLSFKEKTPLSLSLSLSQTTSLCPPPSFSSLSSSFFLLIEFRLIEASIRVCSAGDRRGSASERAAENRTGGEGTQCRSKRKQRRTSPRVSTW